MRENKDIKILIVDDEEDLRKAISFDFKRKGFQVFEAANGAAAFEVVQAHKIDLVISDVRMPGGDGVQLLDKIKEMNPTLPVVMFITGFADLTLEDAYHKGADAVFAKPFDRKVLMEAVVKALSDKNQVWGGKRPERHDVDFKVDIRFPELNFAIQGRVLNIGRGGIFVAITDKFPVVSSKAFFNIEFEDGYIRKIEGSGIVRWIRTQLSENKHTGCGIEFEFLDPESIKQVIDLINSLKTRSFIPKG